MSVYSGFATRKQETTYNNFVFKLIQIFADEILNRRKLGIRCIRFCIKPKAYLISTYISIITKK